MICDIEANIIRFLQTNASINWITLFQFITLFGSYLGFIIVLVIMWFKGGLRLSITFVLTFAFASLINQVLKLIIARDRPFVTYDDIINYGGEDGYSMPSGHSLCAGLFATFVFYTLLSSPHDLSTKIIGGIFCCLFPFLIAYSRMVLGVHYLSDTLVGIALGVLFAVVGLLIHRHLAKMRLKRKIQQRHIK